MIACKQLLFDGITLENVIYPLFMTARKNPTTNCFLYVRPSTKMLVMFTSRQFLFYDILSAQTKMYLLWSLCTLYLHACQVRVTVSDSGLCCWTCVTYFKRWLTPLYVDSARALGASFCFRFITLKNFIYSLFMAARKNPTTNQLCFLHLRHSTKM